MPQDLTEDLRDLIKAEVLDPEAGSLTTDPAMIHRRPTPKKLQHLAGGLDFGVA